MVSCSCLPESVLYSCSTSDRVFAGGGCCRLGSARVSCSRRTGVGREMPNWIVGQDCEPELLELYERHYSWQARRIHGLPKYLLPTKGGFLARRLVNLMSTQSTPQLIVHRNLDRLARTYIKPEWVVSIDHTRTMVDTLLISRFAPQIPKAANILFGMPDTYFEDIDAFKKLRERLDAGADVVLDTSKRGRSSGRRWGCWRLMSMITWSRSWISNRKAI